MKHRRWQFAGVSLALVALFARSSAPARSSARIAGAPATAAAGQLAIAGTAGGTASITGVQLPSPVVTVQATGVGRIAFTGTNAPPPVNGTVVAKASIDLSQMPPAVQNGTITVTAPNGDVIQGAFQGQTSLPDAAGFSDVNASLTLLNATGKYQGAQASGTVTGTVNFARSAFSLTANGVYTAPPSTSTTP